MNVGLIRNLMVAGLLMAPLVLGAVAGDRDEDSVSDLLDECPDTPPGVRVDGLGCPQAKDEDADGVRDTADDCPRSPPGARVDRRGCALDTDRDGVADGIDRCNDTSMGVATGPEGCAALQVAETPPPAPAAPAASEIVTGASGEPELVALEPAPAEATELPTMPEPAMSEVAEPAPPAAQAPAAVVAEAMAPPASPDQSAAQIVAEAMAAPAPDAPAVCPAVPAPVCPPPPPCPVLPQAAPVAAAPAVPAVAAVPAPVPATPTAPPAMPAASLPAPFSLPLQLEFATQSRDLSAETRAELERIVPELKALLDAEDALKLQIVGHASPQTEIKGGEELSERRAWAVRSYLTQQGIAGTRLRVAYRGTTEARGQVAFDNRRVVIRKAP